MTAARNRLAITELTAMLTTDFDLPTVLSTIALDACRGYMAFSAVVGLLDDSDRDGDAEISVVAEALREPTDTDLAFVATGPAYESARDGAVTMIPDLSQSRDTRWPDYRQEALRAGMRGMRAFPVTALGARMGALVVHTDDPWGSARPNDLGQTLANLAALALSIAPQPDIRRGTTEDLIASVLQGSATIASAIGILAETLGATIDEGRLTLNRLARAHGVTVGAHAAAIVAAYDGDPGADLAAHDLLTTPPQLRPPTSIAPRQS
ncbi:GAF domain-containing protein [Mycobacterium frederiksbergense]|uniref:GAF domain-containing protein n=1 Tax=Mycolicibacterium frederiksbergense TaxID=117567 RepID=UPI0021F35EDC|nr:GAF domain-containing protein [Mycolicibacterium frederiksbergense]MCV7048395.1 GAF domain-containing protein [Mycolicibacterium frederiksbergense]